MSNTAEFDRILKSTLDDGRVSRAERSAMKEVLEQWGTSPAMMAQLRARAFAIAAERAEGSRDVILWLEDVVVRRLTAVNRHLPFVLDLLSLSLGAGLDFNSALESVVQKESQKGPLIEELHYVLQEIRLGVTRKDALLNLRDRVQSEYLTTVVGAVIQAEAMGTPFK